MPSFRLLVLLTSISVAGCSLTPPSKPQSSGPMKFICDAGKARFNDWSREIGLNSVRIEGAVRLSDSKNDENWSPTAAAYVRGFDRLDEVGLQFVVFDSAPDKLQALLFVGRDSPQAESLSVVPAAEPIRFLLTVDSDGTVMATVGEVRLAKQIEGFVPRSAGLTCSTGKFTFKDVSIDERQK